MKTRGFLDHLLQTAQSSLKTTGLLESRAQGGTGLSDFGKGSLAGGALGLLLGRNRGLGKLAAYGSLAALGVMAYKAYGSWQNERPGGNAASPAQADAPLSLTAPDEANSRLLLRALVAAAKSDGHIDQAERAMIDNALGSVGADAEMQQWLSAELARPLDPQDIARGVSDGALASEVYLISAAAAGSRSFMEQAYLDGLANALALDPELRARLDAQAASVESGAT